ncbi:MAG: DMT family transporter [Bacillota bacterium]|nr:DMT family transporter [Bacillota bacterium]
MKKSQVKQNIYAVIAALIWGNAFVAQSECAKYLGPFTVNALRSVIAVIALIPVALIFKKIRYGTKTEVKKESRKKLIIGGICCGAVLSAATNLQQAGLSDTGAGKAAFITAMYIVIVPVLGIFLKKKVTYNVWVAVAISVIGFYFLCLFGEGVHFAVSDLYILLCAVIFSTHILLIDHFTEYTDGIELSCVQFIVMAAISAVCMFIFETPTWNAIFKCILPLLYIAIFSSGVAYTLQIFAQKDANPTIITLILSLESIFAAFAERILPGGIKKPMFWWEYFGCALIFTAVVLAQIPLKRRNVKTVGTILTDK